jgi:hypothetical protein
MRDVDGLVEADIGRPLDIEVEHPKLGRRVVEIRRGQPIPEELWIRWAVRGKDGWRVVGADTVV